MTNSLQSPPESSATPPNSSHPPDGVGASQDNRRRRWASLRRWRWALAVVAIALALLGEKQAEDARSRGLAAPPSASWILLGLAALIFVAAVWPVPRLLDAPPLFFLKNLRAMRNSMRLTFIALLALAIVCALASVPLFISLNTSPNTTPAPPWPVNTGSWLLYISSLLLFAAAFTVWERNTPATEGQIEAENAMPGGRLPRRIEWFVMAGLLALALIVRLPNLESAPPGLWFDEANYGVFARQLLSSNGVHQVFIASTVQFGTLYLYFLGIVTKIFGSTVWELRLLPALAGSITVPMIYLLGSRLYGWRVGISAAGLLALSAWNITFSRIGLVSIFTVALDVGVLLCVVQALRTGRLGYYAGAGVLLGLGVQTYYIARLIPLVLLALLAHRLITGRIRLVRTVRVGLVIFVLGALLASVPLDIFALQRPGDFNSRINTVTIFSQEGSGGDPNALSDSFNKHMLMFNFLGDRNGRHNLPNSPMLDWLTAALFFAGLGSCIYRSWRWQYFFPVVWFAAALSGGVLSLLFEAPQSNRTVENSVVTTLIAGILLGEFWQLISRAITREPAAVTPALAVTVPLRKKVELFRGALPEPASLPISKRTPNVVTTLPVRVHPASVATLAPAPPLIETPAAVEPLSGVATTTQLSPARRKLALAVTTIGVLVVVVWAGAMNLSKYFQVQVNDRSVWQDMYSAEGEAARVLAQYKDKYDVYISPVYFNLPPSRYLAPNANPVQWPGMHEIPLKPGRGALLALDPPSSADLAAIKRIYPHATVQPLLAPSSNDPLMYTVFITSTDLSALSGVHATLYDTGSAAPREEKTLQTLEYNWGTQGRKPGTLRMTATLQAPSYAGYTFQMQSANGQASLLVDGYLITGTNPITLGTGLHSIVVTDTVKSAAGVSRLVWSSPGATPQPIPAANLFDPRKIEPRGLTALFRKGTGFTAQLEEGRVDPVVSFYFQQTPLQRPYTAEWSGRLYVPTAGLYGLATEQLSTSQLFLDGKEIITNNQPNNAQEAQVTLTAGWHTIRLYYKDLDNFSHMYLYWTPPGSTRSIIPSAFLWPEMGSYPTKPESGGWPTLAEANGSVWINNAPAQTWSGPTPAPAPTILPGAMLTPIAVATSAPPQLPAQALTPVITIGDGSDALNMPQAAAVDSNGNFYIYTDKDGIIHKFDPGGKALTTWPAQGKDGKPMAEGSALLILNDRLLLLDASAGDVVSYALDGSSPQRTHVCDCYFPRGLAKSQDGNLWVADTGNARVLKVSLKGISLATLGSRGDAPGQFIEPAGVWESPQGTLYVADVGNSRAQSFGKDLMPMAAWPMGASVARDGNRLVGDYAGNVLVTERDSQAVVMYNSTGKELRRWTYTKGGAQLVPAGIAQAGLGSFVVLYPQANTAVVFSAAK